MGSVATGQTLIQGTLTEQKENDPTWERGDEERNGEQ